MAKTVLIQTLSKVQDFLESVARNSEKTRRLYSIALSHFQTFLSSEDKYSKFTAESILKVVSKNQINVYTLIDNFVSYLVSRHENKLSPNSLSLYVAALRSYLLYHDIDIVPGKFKRRVKLPKNHREDEEPLDVADIRRLLLSCNNRRLKPYLLVLASGGMRAVEALAIRDSDIDFSVHPTKIHVRADYAKTRVARDIYVSDEATKFLKEWIEFKYRKKREATLERSDNNLVFGKQARSTNPERLYGKIRTEFNKILETTKMDDRKEGMLRRKVTLHSFRRFVKTVISTQVGEDYSEWFLGHSKSPYWTLKEPQRREIYNTKCLSQLTFLDYSSLETTGKNIEARLAEKEREIAYLRERDTSKEDSISNLSDEVMKMTARMQEQDRLIQELLKIQPRK
jgi:integrase